MVNTKTTSSSMAHYNFPLSYNLGCFLPTVLIGYFFMIVDFCSKKPSVFREWSRDVGLHIFVFHRDHIHVSLLGSILVFTDYSSHVLTDGATSSLVLFPFSWENHPRKVFLRPWAFRIPIGVGAISLFLTAVNGFPLFKTKSVRKAKSAALSKRTHR